jgi:hypothetical protein
MIGLDKYLAICFNILTIQPPAGDNPGSFVAVIGGIKGFLAPKRAGGPPISRLGVKGGNRALVKALKDKKRSEPMQATAKVL